MISTTRVAIALAIAAALSAGAWRIHVRADAAGYARAQGEHAQADKLRAEAARLAEAGHRARERTHTEQLQAIQQKAANDKTRLAADLQRALDSLRNRPERPASGGGDVPTGSAADMGCTGAQLHREDAEFLIRLSGSADQLRVNLARCQAAYEDAVKLTN